MNKPRQVVITGLGIVTAIGLDETSFWNNLMAGKSGIARIRGMDIAPYKAQNGAEVDPVALAAALTEAGIRPNDITVDMGMLAARQALLQAGLLQPGVAPDPRPVATIVGTGAGSNHSIYDCAVAFHEKGVRGIRPTSVPRCMMNAISAQISMRFRLTGPNYVTVAACSSATVAIGIGFRMIRDGYADQVLCVGSDSLFDPLVYAGWNNLGVMSCNPDPSRACRPFDTQRDGCVLGEGAGALLLEAADHARQRGVRSRAEVAGYGESSDAEHITRPNPEGQATAIRAALDSAGLTPADIGYINAHGTATETNDECESEAIRRVFGDLADRVPVGSNKSFFGHLLGACGIAESVACVLTLETGRVPPNLNLDNPDPKCRVRLVGKSAETVNPQAILKNSFGFGGDNAVLTFRRCNA